MVSFQCDGCSDVVKKPKLDQHYGRCGASVSCIDCSKTFQSPAEFKGHTSCISEAEKYQGGLYQGAKHGDQSWNNNARGGFRGRFNGRGRGGDGRGGFQGRPYRGSGPNGIDLGEKVRPFGASTSSPPSASPVPNTAEAASKDTDKQDTKPDDKKGKDHENKKTPDATIAPNAPSLLNKSEKRKAPVESSSEAAPSSGGSGAIEPKKKKKKVYSDVESPSAEAVPRATVATGESSPTPKEKSSDKKDKEKKDKDKKSKDKKDKSSKEKALKALGANTEVAANEEMEKRLQKEKDPVKGTDPVTKKKSKKSKSSTAES